MLLDDGRILEVSESPVAPPESLPFSLEYQFSIPHLAPGFGETDSVTVAEKLVKALPTIIR
jgi:hypothetical protein